MKVVVVGTGYVGLVSGACLADWGHEVVCVDTNAERCAAIGQGRAPFFEPGLDALIQRTAGAGRLTGTTDLAQAMRGADLSMIAVGTPSVRGHIDLSAVTAAAAQIGALLPTLDRYHTVILKSTCVPGTTDGVLLPALQAASGLPADRFGLCVNPEFLREGSALADFRNSDRVVIGACDDRAAEPVERLYAPLACPKLRTSPRNAEMIKYASNSLLATLISFSNEIAALCEAVPGLDERTIMQGLHLDRRLSRIDATGQPLTADIVSYLRAGIGYGGSCLPKDTAALQGFARDQGVPTPILDAVITTNARRADALVALISKLLPDLARTRIAVLGLAFKANTDDVRVSPGLRVAEALCRHGSAVTVWDPMVSDLDLPSTMAPARLMPTLAAAIDGADAAVIATAWPQITDTDWTGLIGGMRHPILVDGRHAIDPARLPDGAIYVPVGRKPAGTTAHGIARPGI